MSFVFFFKQKTAYEMRISDWSSDVCSSDLPKLNDRHPFLGPDARTSEYPVRIPMKPVAETGPEFAIRGGRLFDAVSGGVRPATVVIQGNRIKAVLAPDATGWGADAKIIDAAGKKIGRASCRERVCQ